MLTYTQPFLLSSKGSTRATAYTCANKSVTRDGKLHVVWLDAVAQVCGRTCDLSTGAWGETRQLFTGCDNHTNPALSADREGRLHLAYGPHGYWGNWNNGCFKAVVSAAPGVIDRWTGEHSFGYLGTYASLVCLPDGLDAIVYRGGDAPACLMFQKQRRLGGWEPARPLLGQAIEPQYTNTGGTLACSTDGTLYAACHFYNTGGGSNPPVTGDKGRMGSSGAAVLKSADGGATWTDLAGEPFHTPGYYEPRIAVPPLNSYVYIKGLATDSSGTPWVLTLKPAVDDERILLSCWRHGAWRTADLQPCLPADRIAVDATLTIDTRDRLHLALTAVRRGAPEDVNAWGHPTAEVFHVMTRGTAADAVCSCVSTPDEGMANWLPSISLTGPFHPVDEPTILYTRGVPGTGCSPATETEVWCVRVQCG